MAIGPFRRMTRVRLALGGLAVIAGAAVGGWLWRDRPWQARYLDRPTSYWAGRVARLPRSTLFPRIELPAEGWFDRALEEVGVDPGAGPKAWELYGHHPEAVPVLIELLQDGNPHVRACAARGLQGVKPAPKQALPALLQAWERCRGEYRGVITSENLHYADPQEAAGDVDAAIWEIDPAAARAAGLPPVPAGHEP